MADPFFIFPAVVGLFASVVSLVGLFLVLYALYDVIFRQEQMEMVEKLIWVIAILAFNIFGVLVYFIVVWYSDERLGNYMPLGEGRKLSELERLSELRDEGVLTEEEFQKEKENVLDGRDVQADEVEEEKRQE